MTARIVAVDEVWPKLEQMMALAKTYAPWVEKVNSPRDQRERWNALRKLYKILEPEIMGARPNQWAVDPYICDWPRLFTPIEFALWCDIRAQGLVLYPQYPVGRYFVDFANPRCRVAIECDGAAYHTDAAKDMEREQNINEMGWEVYRFRGRHCLTPDIKDDDGNWIPNPERAGVMLQQIAREHGFA